ncbi:MAG: 16S rRNA (uracil(1498)-N(3))-methyltransferase [Flavobacteriaceae bacterium]|nr:MAG: 16S rRNA (uracil(1498)-N(3))-methyltransferase [Flavobacteriaceae bacterium]
MSKEESRHLVKVLRARISDELWLTDGKGLLAHAKVKSLDQNRAEVEIVERFFEHQKPKAYLHLALAPTKSLDRFEFFVEKTTEIGIQRITPICSANSERKTLNHERTQKKVESALKQSLGAYLPQLDLLISLTDFLNTTDFSSYTHLYIAHCNPNFERKALDGFAPSCKALILIGPEGDFSPKEIELAIQKGFTCIHLGEKRLRTETAGIKIATLFDFLTA